MGDEGQSVYHRMCAALFDEACRLLGKPNTEIAELLKRELARDHLTRNTVSAWRSGEQPVSAPALLAVLKQSDTLATELILLVLLRQSNGSDVRRALPDDLQGALAKMRRRQAAFEAYAAAYEE